MRSIGRRRSMLSRNVKKRVTDGCESTLSKFSMLNLVNRTTKTGRSSVGYVPIATSCDKHEVPLFQRDIISSGRA